MIKLYGFTLIELIVTVAIAAILLTVGVPSFLTLIQNSRMTSSQNDFITDLNLARSEAIKRGSRVTVCKSADSATCTQAGNWSQGWILFADPNNNAQYDGNASDDELIRVYQGFTTDDMTLIGNSNVDNFISYFGTGFSITGSWVLCDSRGSAYAKALVTNNTGRIYSRPANNGECPL